MEKELLEKFFNKNVRIYLDFGDIVEGFLEEPAFSYETTGRFFQLKKTNGDWFNFFENEIKGIHEVQND